MPEGMERDAGMGEMAQLRAEVEELRMLVESLMDEILGGGMPMEPPGGGMPPMGGMPPGGGIPPGGMPPMR